MGFFSCLILAANSEFNQRPDSIVLNEICLKAEVTTSTEYPSGLYNLHPRIRNRFVDRSALAKNERFFFPDSVTFNSKLHVSSFDAESPYSGPGFQIEISGQGYFFPWGKSDLLSLVESSPFNELKRFCDDQFGGSLMIPPGNESLFAEARISHSPGWTWLKSET
jgi:hypothetical protein